MAHRGTSVGATLPPLDTSFQWAPPQLRIDPRRILFIYNTNAAATFSLTGLNYYLGQRKLPTFHRMGFDFGAAGNYWWMPTTSQMWNNYFKPVGDYIRANKIQAVIFAPQTPHYIQYTSVARGADVAICIGNWTQVANLMSVQGSLPDVAAFLAASNVPNIAISDDVTRAGGSYRAIGPSDVPGSSVAMRVNQNRICDTESTGIMWGRIGELNLFPNYYPETEAAFQRIVDDARAQEAVPQSSLARSRQIVMAVGSRIADSTQLCADHVAVAGLLSRSYGHTVQYSTDIYAGNGQMQIADKHFPRSGELFQKDVTGYPNQSNLQIPTFAYWGGGGPHNEDSANVVWANTYDWQPGSFAMETTSYWGHMQRCLEGGGCATIGSLMEPYADVFLESAGIYHRLLQGYTMMEALWLGGVSSGRVIGAFGDPLYAPFGKGLFPQVIYKSPSASRSRGVPALR